MSTGLYKITGTTISDVTRIANITTSNNTATNTMVMSCDLSVLLADPDFSAWYNPANPKFALLSLINRISGTTVTQMDNSSGGFVFPVPLYVDPQTTPVGQISDVTLSLNESEMYFEAEYTKPADHFNWDMNYRTEDSRIYPMFTTDPEFATSRTYRSTNLINEFPEVDNERGRAWVERIPSVYQQSNWLSYSFVRDVNEPENLQMEVVGNQLVLSWDAVTNTPTGTSIVADYYIVEHASDPVQGYTSLPQTSQTTISIPLSDLGDKAFLKVKAVKMVP